MTDDTMRKKDRSNSAVEDANERTNRDPLSGETGAHPVGTAAGATAGAATGAAIGTMVGGPIGMAVGGVAGAVVGGLAGKGIAEAIDPTVEDAYWRHNYSSRPYVTADTSYDTLEPAYRYGWETRAANPERNWEEMENDLASGWERARGSGTLAWEEAKAATRDAWDRVGNAHERLDQDGGPSHATFDSFTDRSSEGGQLNRTTDGGPTTPDSISNLTTRQGQADGTINQPKKR